jgi:hypothetical protein
MDIGAWQATYILVQCVGEGFAVHMRFKAAFLLAILLVASLMLSACSSLKLAAPPPVASALSMIHDGRHIFRHDTFGSEAFWGGRLLLHQAFIGAQHGGIGPGVSPNQALALGLKVDVLALPSAVVPLVLQSQLNLNDPASTVVLLKHDAVVGVKAFWDSNGCITSIGIQCALCHSTVDDSITYGIGHRLDGWANRDLDIGKIISLAPNLQPLADMLCTDQASVRTVLGAWGPGKFDAQLVLDGKGFRPDGRTAATLLPPAFGLAGVNLHTSTGWGSVTHWNAFVSNLEMKGQGTFYDPRLLDPVKFPLAVRNGFFNVRNSPDLTTAKLASLHFYQLALVAPEPPAGSFDPQAAEFGRALFHGKATCARCHVPPLFTEPGWNMHAAEEIGIDNFQAMRSPDERYRTTPLKGLWTHTKGGFYHDGRFPTLHHVVAHYNYVLGLNLTVAEAHALVEYLKSL